MIGSLSIHFRTAEKHNRSFPKIYLIISLLGFGLLVLNFYPDSQLKIIFGISLVILKSYQASYSLLHRLYLAGDKSLHLMRTVLVTSLSCLCLFIAALIHT